jgi:hypothetical protein
MFQVDRQNMDIKKAENYNTNTEYGDNGYGIPETGLPTLKHYYDT